MRRHELTSAASRAQARNRRRTVAALLVAALVSFLNASAFAQQFPLTMQPNSVYCRLGISAGPGQSCPFSLFKSILGGGETPVSDANYPAQNTDSVIAYTALTAARTVTLPAASSVAGGTRILLLDRSGKASNTVSLSITPTGGDLINGYNQSVAAVTAPWQSALLESDGSSHWTFTTSAPVRNQLTAGQNYWINGNTSASAACGPTGAQTCSAGSDSNDCLTPATACRSVQHVVDLVIFKTDLAGFTATIYLAHGSSQAYSFTCEEGPLVGQSVFSVQGDGNSTTAVTIIAANGDNTAVSVKDSCTVGIANVAFANSIANNASAFVSVGDGGYGHVDLTNVSFGAITSGTAVAVTYGGSAAIIGSSNTVTGSANALLSAAQNGTIDVAGTITGSSNLTFTTGLAIIQQSGTIADVQAGTSGWGSSGATFQGFSGVIGPSCVVTSSNPFTTNPNKLFPGGQDCIASEFVGQIQVQSGSGTGSSYNTGTTGQLLASGGSSGKNTYDNLSSHLTAGTDISLSGTTNVTVGLTNNATTVAGQTCTLGSTCGLSSFTAQLSGDVSLSNIANYFDGPSVAQGTSGTWVAFGTVGLNSSTNDQFRCKLWDGTTVIAATTNNIVAGSGAVPAPLSGIITSPAGNIKISCRDISSTNGTISANSSANGNKDSTITVVRLQ